MNFLSLLFLGAFAGFLVIYYLTPAKYRYLAVLVGSYIFYGFGHPKMLISLIGLTAVSYIGGLLIETKKSRVAFVLSFAIEIIVLIVFKYTNFIIGNINALQSKLGIDARLSIEWNILLPTLKSKRLY